MKKQDTNKDRYRTIAQFYDALLNPFLADTRNKVTMLSKADQTKIVLEVACGTGEQALLYAREGAEVIGLDISRGMLTKAKKKPKNLGSRYAGKLTFMHGDATRMPFSDEEFDISSIALALHEMKPSIRGRVLEEMKRVTKDKGTVIIVDYAKPDKQALLTRIYTYVIRAVEFIAGAEHYKNYKDFMNSGGIPSLVYQQGLKICDEKRTYHGNIAILKLALFKDIL